ncbi:MAG: hypothetical protein HYV07_17230 [Deltaproteobacteria bacterium]|nr:hypothetical protein [Deltaproteobacteria bacterium]
MAFPVNSIQPRHIGPRDEKERVTQTPSKDGGEPKTSVGVATFARKDGPSDQGNQNGGGGSNQGGSNQGGQTFARVQAQNVPGNDQVNTTQQVTTTQNVRPTDQLVKTNGTAGVPNGWQRYMPHMLGKPIRIRGPVPSEFSSQISNEMNLARIQHRPMNRDHVASGRYDRIP